MMMTETKAYGMRLKDHEALMASSSGGAFTALSDVFLNSGNAVVCSSFDFETHRQEFRVITSKKERDAARGSKYFQSVPGDSFRAAEQWLKDHGYKYTMTVETRYQFPFQDENEVVLIDADANACVREA